jgi:hypothetical protein
MPSLAVYDEDGSLFGETAAPNPAAERGQVRWGGMNDAPIMCTRTVDGCHGPASLSVEELHGLIMNLPTPTALMIERALH